MKIIWMKERLTFHNEMIKAKTNQFNHRLELEELVNLFVFVNKEEFYTTALGFRWCFHTLLSLQTETLVLRAERRSLCDCMATNSLGWTPSRWHLAALHTKTTTSNHARQLSSPLIHGIGTLFFFLSFFSVVTADNFWGGFTCLSRGVWHVCHVILFRPQPVRELRDYYRYCFFLLHN